MPRSPSTRVRLGLVPFACTTTSNRCAAPPETCARGGTSFVLDSPTLPQGPPAWPASAPRSDDQLASEVFLEEAGSNLYIAGTDYVDAAPAAFTLPASGCMGLP